MQLNQQITFLSNGGESVHDLQLYMSPQAELILDRFHIARQEVDCVIVRRDASRTWCPITSTLERFPSSCMAPTSTSLGGWVFRL
jgi:hypothetical protein